MDNFDVNRFVAEGIEDEGWTVESFGICPIVNMIWNWFKKWPFFVSVQISNVGIKNMRMTRKM